MSEAQRNEAADTGLTVRTEAGLVAGAHLAQRRSRLQGDSLCGAAGRRDALASARARRGIGAASARRPNGVPIARNPRRRRAAPGVRAPARQSEDCLNLNIWAPAAPKGEKLPVMVWLFGGGFMVGSATDGLFDGEKFAQQGVILITANYRVGVFGFLAHPALTAESPHRSSSNYALLDQLAALALGTRQHRQFRRRSEARHRVRRLGRLGFDFAPADVAAG